MSMYNVYVSANAPSKSRTLAAVVRNIPRAYLPNLTAVRTGVGHWQGERETVVILTYEGINRSEVTAVASDLAMMLDQDYVLVAPLLDCPRHTYTQLDTLPASYTRRDGVGQPAYAYMRTGGRSDAFLVDSNGTVHAIA